METIHFYHTNDIHSHFENWPQISRLLHDRRREHKLKEKLVIYLISVIMWIVRIHLQKERKEKGMSSLLNEAGYDAVTIGNNEGITMSKEALSSLYDDAEFDVILGNLFDMNGSFRIGQLHHKIYETARGTKIGVIGATAIYTQFYSSLGWKVDRPREKLKRIAENIASRDRYNYLSYHIWAFLKMKSLQWNVR